MSNIKKILSIDGGGIRGVIPAMVLSWLEDKTGKSISSMFDLVAGTSTGGILALGLNLPGEGGKPRYKANDLLNLYEKEGRTIFSRSLWHKIHAVGNVLEERYSQAGIESVLDKYFGKTRLKEVVKPVLITSYEIEQRLPFFFRSERAKKDAAYDFPVKKVARATSAAPTYFEPLKLETDESVQYYALVDGGVFANNPAMCAYVEGLTSFPDAEDFLVVSLGTGQLTRPILYNDAKDWGLLGWAQPLLSVIFDGVNDTVEYQLKQLLPPKDKRTRYYRLQVRLNEGSDDMDDASRTNLRVLKLIADKMISDNEKALDELAKQLAG
jgi:patatin-like phospholipase/acyl hydrolase